MPIIPTPSANATLSVSATLPATNDQAGYEALTFTRVGGITEIPEIGESNEEGSVDTMDGRVKYISILDGKSIETSMLEPLGSTDPGQAIINDAAPAGSSAGRTVAARIQSADGSKTAYAIYTVLGANPDYGGATGLMMRKVNMSQVIDTFLEVNT